MLIKYHPNYIITPKMAGFLLRLESAKEKVLHLPLTPIIAASLRETARLFTTHYSTMIEGNRLEPAQIDEVLQHAGHFPGRERDEREVKGYYTALHEIEQWAAEQVPISETRIKTLHALVMADGRSKVKPTPYREGQNIIRDSMTRNIVYMPPEAKDVSGLMKGFVQWLLDNQDLPTPLTAAIAHYQFTTIHPYFDGNGRTARLLTTWLLHSGGYDLKGLYSLEEYYATHLEDYYSAISIGPSHNYYLGRAEADITTWLEYFLEGMAISFESVLRRMDTAKNQGLEDRAELLRQLDPKQRRALELFCTSATVASHQIGALFGVKPRTSTLLCKNWVDAGFLDIVDFSNKSRSYRLAKKYQRLIE